MNIEEMEQTLTGLIERGDKLLAAFILNNKSPTYELGRLLYEGLSPQSQEAYAYLADVGAFFDGLMTNPQGKMERGKAKFVTTQAQKVITSAVAVMANAPAPFAASIAGTAYVRDELYRLAEKINPWKLFHSAFIGACVEHAYNADFLRAVLNLFEPDEKPFIPRPRRDARASGFDPL